MNMERVICQGTLAPELMRVQRKRHEEEVDYLHDKKKTILSL
jgi:hypothetical protein